jgi:hypothetical protein
MSLETLARKADIHIKSLKRILNGGRSRLDTIGMLANALGTNCDNLRADIPKADLIPAKPATFTLSHTVTGVMDSLAKIRQLLTLSPALQQLLDEAGVKIDGVASMLAVQDQPDGLKRTIVMLNGRLDTGAAFFVIAAVRPGRYELFQQNYRFGLLDIHKFDAYGEVLVCGEGDTAPDGVWEKVAEMYQTDAKTILAAMTTEPPPRLES